MIRVALVLGVGLIAPAVASASTITLKSDRLFITSRIAASYEDGSARFLEDTYSGSLVTKNSVVGLNYLDDGAPSTALAGAGAKKRGPNARLYDVALWTIAATDAGQEFERHFPRDGREADVEPMAYAIAQTVFRVDGTGAEVEGWVDNETGLTGSGSYGKVVLKDLTTHQTVLSVDDPGADFFAFLAACLESGHLYKAIAIVANDSGSAAPLGSGFRTRHATVTVPEPGSTALFAVGLLGLVLLKRRGGGAAVLPL